ncbi:GATA-C-like protein [Leptotrombidium deliense]|uniref:GATA-C-like protein n=1 Tax=Leptotrombidium deliense TaxID=299467 RepID=A0A443SKE3_9ACAR|nr:GATA-C-like protein [Leptotrombidium deliense]
MIVPDDMDVFYHPMSESNSNMNAASYYNSSSIRPQSLNYARVSGQVCRPHFHSALHPWISAADTKGPPMVPHPAHHSGAPWCSPFTSKPSPHHANHSRMAVHAHGPSASSHSSPHLFTFPPTPPKDATPDNVSGHSQPSATNTANVSISEFGGTSLCSSSDASLEMKSHYVGSSHHPMITSWGSTLSNSASCNKQREVYKIADD